MKQFFLTVMLALLTVGAYAQNGGVKGKVVSRDGRVAVGGVKVSIEGGMQNAVTDQNGDFVLENLPKGTYKVNFEAPEFEDLTIMVRVDKLVRDVNKVVIVPNMELSVDDSIFAELDSDVESSGDNSSLPSSLSASKDVFNNIASYKFSEMRFNVRGYDSQYTDVYLNGIRFNDAMTGYGPWSLWSGLNDATRNQESTSGLQAADCGLGGIGGTTNINARASQMRKGLRASVVNGNSMYRFRAMISYASGSRDDGWSYGFSLSTRQGGNGYVDGVYYNGYGYFGSVEKQFNSRHRLALTVMGAPTQRGAQMAATEEAYQLFGDHYYNPNVGYQNGKLRNARVRNTHEPIVMLNYNWQISENTALSAAASFRFGYNGYSALTWNDGTDPRPDYYRYLPSYYGNRVSEYLAAQAVDPNTYTDVTIDSYRDMMIAATRDWTGRIDWDGMIQDNYNGKTDATYGTGHRSNRMIEERHTDQRDFNFVAQINHSFRDGSKLMGGVRVRVNRTEYYDQVKDLLGGDYWVDEDKFALRDFGNDAIAYQNNLAYYNEHGHAQAVTEGDKFGYDYYAHVQQGQLWAMYQFSAGGFSANVGAEVGFSSMWREGRWEKGLFANANAGGDNGLTSLGNSDKINDLTYKAKANLRYVFSGAHSLEANVTYMQNAPTFNNAFVSARTRNQITPGLSPEKVFGVDLSYNLRTPWIRARLSGYYTTVKDQSRVISFYDDLLSSFTNFAMSGIDKRYAGLELGVNVPIAWGLQFNAALSYGDYIYTSNPQFTQMVDNSATDKIRSVVNWKNMNVESTPQTALNLGLSFRGNHNWFASIDFNYYDRIYLSMNPMYRTRYLANRIMDLYDFENLETGRQKMEVIDKIESIKAQEKLKHAFTLNASVGKNWYIRYKYTLGFSLEVKNILNDQNIRTGGYEQMRLNKPYGPTVVTDAEGSPRVVKMYNYKRFDSKYFYMLGITYYLNVYFRF